MLRAAPSLAKSILVLPPLTPADMLPERSITIAIATESVR